MQVSQQEFGVGLTGCGSAMRQNWTFRMQAQVPTLEFT